VTSLLGTRQAVVVRPVPAGGPCWLQGVPPVPSVVQPLTPPWKSSVKTALSVVPAGQVPGTPVVKVRTAENVPAPQ